jgi:PAS domain S-box-containing protein
MAARLWKLLAGPPAEIAEGKDLKTALTATVLWRVSVIGILWCAFVYFPLIVPLFVVRKGDACLLGAIWIGAPLATVILVRQRRICTASWVLLAGWWGVATLLVALSGGIHSVGVGLFVPLIVFTGWLFGKRAVLCATGLFFAMTLALALFEEYGVTMPRYFPGTPLAIWSVFLLAASQLVVSLVLVYAAFGDALTLARRRAGELSQLAQELQESEDRLRTIVEAAPDGIFILNAAGRIVGVNEAATRQLGYTRGELLQLGVADFVAPEFRERAKSRFPDMESRPPYESRHLRKDGTEVPVELNTRRLVYAGEPALLAVARDISERKEAQLELQVSEARFRTLTEDAPIAISISRQGRVLYGNPMYLRMFGLRGPEDLNDRVTLDSFTPEEVSERAMRRDQGLSAPREYEAVGCRMDGSEFPMLVSVSAMQFAEGPALVAFITDLTEQKRAQEERERLEQQFRQAQKLESIGRLAGGVAHDFNNLLTVINGYAEMGLGMLHDGGAPHDCLTEIRKAGERAAGLTHQLLAFSRKNVLEPQAVDLNDLIQDSYKMLRRVVGEDIEIVTDLGRPGQVMSDPGQIHQILLNLVVNARDAMPTGGQITLRTRRLELDQAAAVRLPGASPGSYALVEVIDTGMGMSEEVQQKIFEPFFTTKPKGAGTGLGLSTVYGIVQQSGGWIAVESHPQKGSTFRIGFPRRTGAGSQAGRVVQQAVQLEGRETVLVVEDQDDVRRLVVSVLQEYGYQTLEASSGDGALAIVERHEGTIDLMLTDLIMPGMTGRQAAEKLRLMRPAMKVLYMSGHADDVITRRGGLETGIDYIAKPFTPELLLRKIRTVLGGAAANTLKRAGSGGGQALEDRL